MIPLILLCSMLTEPVDEHAHLPPLTDRRLFPGLDVVHAQLEQWRIHVDRLKYLRLYYPLLPDEWIAEARRNVRYYELLVLADDSDFGEGFHRERLNNLLLLIGPDAYFGGWRPVELDPEKMWPKPLPRRAGQAEANGA